MVQWLGLHTFTAVVPGSISGPGTKVLQAMLCSLVPPPTAPCPPTKKKKDLSIKTESKHLEMKKFDITLTFLFYIKKNPSLAHWNWKSGPSVTGNLRNSARISERSYLKVTSYDRGFPWWLSGKESTCQCRFNSWILKIPWRRKWQSTPVLHGKLHGQGNLAGYSPWGHKRVWYVLATKQQQAMTGCICR